MPTAIRILSRSSLTSLALLLAACGGGGGGPPVSTPAPTPTPTPAPAPSPTPTPVATLDDPVVQDTTYPTVYAGYLDGTNFVGKWNEDLKLRYSVSDDTITAITSNGTEYEFETPATDPGHPFPKNETYGDVTPSDTRPISINFSQPSINGVPMSYMTWGRWSEGSPGAGDAIHGTFITGIPTPVVPKTGTATYDTYVGGTSDIFAENILGITTDPLHADAATTRYRLSGYSTATLGIDFGTGAVSTLLHLTGVYFAGTPISDPNETIDYGEYVGSGQLQSGGPAFEGTFAGADGSFSGALFGPDAAEAGYIFQIIEGDALLRGTVFGRKR